MTGVVRFIFIRLMGMLTTLLVLAGALFALYQWLPGDPIEDLAGGARRDQEGSFNPRIYAERYATMASRYGMDQPYFYFSVVPAGLPEAFLRIPDHRQRAIWKSWYQQLGDAGMVESWWQSLEELAQSVSDPALITVARNALRERDLNQVLNTLDHLPDSLHVSPKIEDQIQQIHTLLLSSRWLGITLRWHGAGNQFHHWVQGLWTGDFGRSMHDGRPVTRKITEALRWTLSINGIAILLALLIAVPLGVYLAAFASRRASRVIRFLLYAGYAMPVFWLATLLVVLFTSDTYGMDWLPSIGVQYGYASASFADRLFHSLGQLFIPVCTLVITSLAYLTRQMEKSVEQQLSAPYLVTAQVWGMPRNQRIWKYVLPNALFPVITLIGTLLPVAIAGSVTLEFICNIPGMGRLLLDSILTKDWPVLFYTTLLIGMVTLFGILLADLIYALVDPRVRQSGFA